MDGQDRAAAAELIVATAVDDTADPNDREGPRAHDAGLTRHIERRPVRHAYGTAPDRKKREEGQRIRLEGMKSSAEGGDKFKRGLWWQQGRRTHFDAKGR